MSNPLFKKIFYYMIVVLIIAINNYIIETNYSPNNFDRTKLLQKKFRCIRNYQDTMYYNKHMEKTCKYYKNDNEIWMNKKKLHENINKIATFACLLIIVY